GLEIALAIKPPNRNSVAPVGPEPRRMTLVSVLESGAAAPSRPRAGKAAAPASRRRRSIIPVLCRSGFTVKAPETRRRTANGPAFHRTNLAYHIVAQMRRRDCERLNFV